MNSNSRVFVVQERTERAPDGSQRPRYNLEEAEHYGSIHKLLHWSDTRHPVQIERLVWKLRRKLKGFSDADYLLMIGSPLAMGLAISIAQEMNSGRVAILSYDRVREEYDLFRLDLNCAPV